MSEAAIAPAVADSGLPVLRFRLPGRWWPVPLHDAAGARASIRELVREQVGRADELAGLREALARRTLAALDQAIAGAGQSMHLALEIVPGVPLPASFTVFLLDPVLAPAVGTDPSRVVQVMERAVVEGRMPGFETRTRFTAHRSEVLRVHRVREAEVQEGGADGARLLLIDYWVTVPGTKRMVLVSCSSALVELQHELLGFFDAVIRASYWAEPSA